MRIVAFIFLSFLLLAPAAQASEVTITGAPSSSREVRPEPKETPPDPGAFVNTLYQAALAIGGLIGFGSLVYGAILYSIAGGNTSRAHEARAQITQAFLGLLLLFGAYLVLETINPNIVNSLKLPSLLDLEKVPPPATGVTSCGGSVYGSCPEGGGSCVHTPYPNGSFACTGFPVASGEGCLEDGGVKCSPNPRERGCKGLSDACKATCATRPQCKYLPGSSF